jgi:hypothetical protein
MKASGVIMMYNPKGFGFILSGKIQHFFHVGNWTSMEIPKRGMVVLYEVGPSKNPRFETQAINVEPVTEESAKAAAFQSTTVATGASSTEPVTAPTDVREAK